MSGSPFFGHSMGGLLACRPTVAMEREGGPSPVLLGVSAWTPILHRARLADSVVAATGTTAATVT